ncbi:MAG: STAS domain-containing protein [Leptospiraceae bacterium]|nr:STAS domain-containing protein [Leptospiraceae bacterium]MCP5495387.1 STAS domain-containing protein [Leptospiraceae bacterium]
MLFYTIKEERHLILSILENIKMDNSRRFSKELLSLLDESPNLDYLSFDLKKVSFLDSSGIGVILRTAVKAKARQIKVNVFNLNHSILSILKLSGVHNILNIYEDEEFYNEFSEFRRK